MNAIFYNACLTATLITLLSTIPTYATAKGTGVTLNLDDRNPLSKWGRWTYLEQNGNNYGIRLGQDRGRMPLNAEWREGKWVFKLNKDMLSDRHDLFFGIRLSESQEQTTSIGCMSNSKSNGYGTALCGVQLDLNLR
jgi:hypothetical protein